MKYYYHVLPVGNADSCIGHISNPLAVTAGPYLMIKPDYDDGILFVDGRYRSVKFFAYGGYGYYTWSISSGTLPQGLSFDTSNGRLYGTTSSIGTYPITISVTDNNDPNLYAQNN